MLTTAGLNAAYRLSSRLREDEQSRDDFLKLKAVPTSFVYAGRTFYAIGNAPISYGTFCKVIDLIVEDLSSSIQETKESLREHYGVSDEGAAE